MYDGPMYFLLLYDVVEDMVNRRVPYRAEHLGQIQELAAKGIVSIAGACGDPVDGAVIVFKTDDLAVVERFALGDPYVTNGLVTRWQVKPWHVVIGGAQ